MTYAQPRQNAYTGNFESGFVSTPSHALGQKYVSKGTLEILPSKRSGFNKSQLAARTPYFNYSIC